MRIKFAQPLDITPFFWLKFDRKVLNCWPLTKITSSYSGGNYIHSGPTSHVSFRKNIIHTGPRVDILTNSDPLGGGSGKNKQISENEEEMRVLCCLAEIRRRKGRKL